jgi:hypothetical protein
MRQHWIQRVASLIVLAIMFVTLSPAKPALALGGVYHNPTGIDELYSTEPTERAPRDPMAGDTVFIKSICLDQGGVGEELLAPNQPVVSTRVRAGRSRGTSAH